MYFISKLSFPLFNIVRVEYWVVLSLSFCLEPAPSFIYKLTLLSRELYFHSSLWQAIIDNPIRTNLLGSWVFLHSTSSLKIPRLTCRYSTVLYNTIEYSTVPNTTLLYSTLHYSTLLYSTLQYSTVLYSTLQYSTVLYSTLQYSIVWRYQGLM